ncbi:MAG: bifunctional glutamate N-acetyltransferase/amino-acid acetyltransferase ArgJ [Actinomycetes bacterium]
MSVTAVPGFRASGVTAGLKDSGRPDLALVVNDGPDRAAAGVFTRNRVQAAPVQWSRQVLTDGRVDAVVLNSGGANACTGPDGFADAHATAEHAAELLGCSAADVALCSTGLIGVRLPLDVLLAGLDKAVASMSTDAGHDAAGAILTTDTVSKTAVTTGNGFTVGGMAKGAGMLAPGLATMLAVLTTDAVADPAMLDEVLRAATARTFDRVDSDGCMSTNDTVLLLANGASGVTPADGALAEAVHSCCADLARALVADAEGASKDIAVEVTHAATEDDALEVARAVARSGLLKCAIHGEDPNWGRVLAAAGTTAAAFDPARLAVAINGVQVCRAGAPGEDPARVDMSDREVRVVVDLAEGQADATVWTNDLTAAYVHENSAYST